MTIPDSEDPGLSDDEIKRKYSYTGARAVLMKLSRLDVVKYTYQLTCTNCQKTTIKKSYKCIGCNALRSQERTYSITFRLHQRDPIRE